MSKIINAIPAGYESDEDQMEFLMATLKIKRLEDITTGAGLNGSNFEATLNMEHQLFFEGFKENWNMHSKSQSPHLRQQLRGVLLRHDTPLVLALKIFANCPDSSNVKNKSLSHFVLDTMCKLYLEMPQLSENCDANTSMIAFNFVKTTGLISLNNAIIQTYRLLDIRELLLPKLRELLDEGYYKEVTQWAIPLQLTHEFDMLDIAFPLIAQEKLPLAEEYLDNATQQRLPFVQFLDSLLHKDKPVIAMCEDILERYKNLKVSHHVLTYRPISKMVGRLAKKYNFDDSTTPNLKFTKTCAYLNHLYREYEKGSIGVLAFRELVKEFANTYALQINFVNYVAAAQAHNEAAYWYKTFKLQPSDCPREIKALISNNELADEACVDSGDIGAPPACDVYLTMDLSDQCMIIVDTAKTFKAMLAHLQRVEVIYMDSEWKQNVCIDSQLCLLQIATTDKVYLIDCLAKNTLHADNWRALGATVFNNANILKIGFSIRNDLAMLQSSLPLQLRLQVADHYLDMYTLWKYLKRQRHGVELPHGHIKNAGDALTDLTLVCLGKKLNKENQCSNWANRPLRPDQIHYAALDVRCLYLIHKVLLTHVQNINVAIEKSVTANNFPKRSGITK